MSHVDLSGMRQGLFLNLTCDIGPYSDMATGLWMMMIIIIGITYEDTSQLFLIPPSRARLVGVQVGEYLASYLLIQRDIYYNNCVLR